MTVQARFLPLDPLVSGDLAWVEELECVGDAGGFVDGFEAFVDQFFGFLDLEIYRCSLDVA